MRKKYSPAFKAKAALAFVLCLTGLVMSGTAFAQRCVDNRDGTVTDNVTGLMWQKDTAGRMNWDAAMSYASRLSLGGHSDWRLPDEDELMRLYHSPCKNMMYVKSLRYWTSTTLVSNMDLARLVDFYRGELSLSYKSDTWYARGVRSAQ